MVGKVYNILIWSFILLLFVSCTKPDLVEPVIIVEGWIEEGGHPFVLLHQSVVIGEEAKDIESSMEDKVIYFGKVVVSDGTDSIVLMGKLDTTYLPPYRYSSVRMRGEVGKTYELCVEYKDYFVTASTTIPSKAFMDSLLIERIVDKNICRLQIYMTDRYPNEKNYYALFYREIGDIQYTNCFMGITDDLVTNNGVISFPVYKGAVGTRDSYFSLGDNIEFKIVSMDSLSYSFWKTFLTLSGTFQLPFFSVNEQLISTVHGGRGYWCGYSGETYPVRILKDTMLRFQ